MIVACIALFVALGGTSYAAIKLPANSVGTKQIKSGAVTAVKIKSGSLTGAQIKDGSLSRTQIADGSLTGAQLADGSLTGAQIADGSLTGAQIRDGSLTGSKIQAATLGKVPSAATADGVVAGSIGPAAFGTIPGARVHSIASTISIPSSTPTPLSFDVIDFNVGGVFDGARPTRMTAPVAGRYLIIASVGWDRNIAGTRSLLLRLVESGSAETQTIACNSVTPYASGGEAFFVPQQTVQTVYELQVGDYVEAVAVQNSGSALNALGLDGLTSFTLHWLAP